MAMKLSISVPVYNEQQTINEVIERVMSVDRARSDYRQQRLVRRHPPRTPARGIT
jgi:glycosyltransferase involved in cell wall biosynthesis